jgi:hypothetical protein
MYGVAMARLFLLLTIFLFVLTELINAQPPPAKGLINSPIRGRVILPDGTPAIRAEVEVLACTKDRVSLVKLVQTDETGSFSILSFSTDCADYTFKASLKREMWLSTGLDAFYLQPNGTTPFVHLEPGVVPELVTIRLNDQGGEVELRVLDEATGSYLKAGVSLKRTGAKRPNIALVSFVVDPVNLSYVRLLPAGNYRVEVDRYLCGEKHIWLATPIGMDFVIAARERQQVVVTVNTKSLKPSPTYDNHSASRCTP